MLSYPSFRVDQFVVLVLQAVGATVGTLTIVWPNIELRTSKPVPNFMLLATWSYPKYPYRNIVMAPTTRALTFKKFFQKGFCFIQSIRVS